MKKSIIKECISLKNNPKKIENDSQNIQNSQLLNSNKLSQNALRTLFLKFKTQRTSPKRISHLTIKNDSSNKDKYCFKNQKKDDSKAKIKVITKNGSVLIKSKLNILNYSSNENNNKIHFRNKKNQNNRYSPKSFEKAISNNFNRKEDEIIVNNFNNANIQKYRSSNIINIKRKDNKSEIKDFNKKNKKKIKIIRTQDIYYRNHNFINNNTLKDYAFNFGSSNSSNHNNSIKTRINSYKNYESVNISYNHLNFIQNKEEYPLFSKKKISLNKLDLINSNNFYKKINNQKAAVTVNISRKFSGKKNISNNQSYKIKKNRTSIKDDKISLLLMNNNNNNSNIQNKIINNKKLNDIINNHIKFNKNEKNEYKDKESKLNSEIKVLKPYRKKKRIMLIGKNNVNSNIYKYCNTNIIGNSSTKSNEIISSLLLKKEINILNNDKNHISKDNKRPIIYKLNKIKNQKIQLNNILRNTKENNYKILKKKVSISNTKSKNSKNNSVQKKPIIKNKNIINNNKTIINTFEKQKSLQKIQIKQSLIKKLIDEKKKTNQNLIIKNTFENKVNKNRKSVEKKIITIFPNIKKNKKKKQYTLTCNSRTITPLMNINIINNSCINNIKNNKNKIDENNIDLNHINTDSSKDKKNYINNYSIDYDIFKKENKEYKNSNLSESNQEKKLKSNLFLEQSEKLSKYIKNYYIINNDYPPSNINFYKFGRVIGKGAFGKVNIGLHILTGRIVAIKSFNKTKINDQKYRNKIMNEIELMKNLNHFSVVKLLDTIETEKYILIIMENVLGGDLLTFIKKRNKLPDKVAKFIFKQLLQALKYIHNKNIVHRDIKLDNILIDLNNNIKLCDFGVGKYISDNGELLFEQCGTPAYIAPEVLSGEGYEGFPVDLWSSGVVLYSLLMGSIPFKANNINELQGLIMSGNYKQINGISKNAKDLLNKLLEINPKKRINVEEALNHPWFSDSIDNKSSLFTKAELILLSKNNVDYRNCTNEEIIENFTIENLDTNKFNENKNNKTKSFVFAPFNTSYDSEELKLENKNLNSIRLEQGIYVQNNIILFDQDANALNRQYELNNNGEIDHGVIINNSNETGNKKNINNNNLNEEKNKQENVIKIEDKTNQNDNSEKNEGNLIIKVEKANYKPEKNKGNIIKINKQKIPYDSIRNKNMHSMLTTYSSNMTIDENILKNMENFGYKKEYVQKCILNNDINYCHATYYLLLNSSNFTE